MSYPKGTLIRNTTAARINHWITAACFVLLMLSGLSMFDPMLFFLSGLFGGGQSTRAIHPWIGIVLLISYAGLIVQFWRDNGWNRDDVAWLLILGAGAIDISNAFGGFTIGMKIDLHHFAFSP